MFRCINDWNIFNCNICNSDDAVSSQTMLKFDTIHFCTLQTHKPLESTSLLSWAHQSRFFPFPIPPHNPPLNIVGYYPVVIDNVQI